jgi:vacuole morphology and inheritance protein 14
LDILCEISRYKEEYTELILCKLLDKLSLNKNLLNYKGLIILKKLCSVLPVTRVFLKFADVIIRMKDFEFIANMLNILDIFLITYKETEPLRNTLRQYKKKKKDPLVKEFFEKLFKAWCYNPISTLSFCIISEYFSLSYHLILKL